MRAAIIVNPYSSGMTSRREREIVKTLRETMDVEVRRTERGGHAPQLAREMIESGRVDVMIACGGDGVNNIHDLARTFKADEHRQIHACHDLYFACFQQ